MLLIFGPDERPGAFFNKIGPDRRPKPAIITALPATYGWPVLATKLANNSPSGPIDDPIPSTIEIAYKTRIQTEVCQPVYLYFGSDGHGLVVALQTPAASLEEMGSAGALVTFSVPDREPR
jgi:hypothetical protein